MSEFLQCVIDANVGIKRFITDPLTLKVRQLFDTLYNSQTENILEYRSNALSTRFDTSWRTAE